MKPTTASRNRVTKYAIWGGISLGMFGFATGAFICLHYHLPIPPLFITELGLLVGGCLGALCALTNSEKKILPSLLAFLGTVLVAFGFGIEWLHAVGAALALSIVVWTTVETPGSDLPPWRNV